MKLRKGFRRSIYIQFKYLRYTKNSQHFYCTRFDDWCSNQPNIADLAMVNGDYARKRS